MTGFADHQFGFPSLTETAVQLDKEIFASYSPQPRIVGVTLESGQSAVWPSGTILGRVDATDTYIQFLDTASDGSEVPRGVLRSLVDATGSVDRPGEMVTFGHLKVDQIEEPTDGTIAEAIVAGGVFANAIEDAVTNELRLV